MLCASACPAASVSLWCPRNVPQLEPMTLCRNAAARVTFPLQERTPDPAHLPMGTLVGQAGTGGDWRQVSRAQPEAAEWGCMSSLTTLQLNLLTETQQIHTVPSTSNSQDKGYGPNMDKSKPVFLAPWSMRPLAFGKNICGDPPKSPEMEITLSITPSLLCSQLATHSTPGLPT